MISARVMGKSFLMLHLTMTLLNKNYLLPPTEAVNGFIWRKNESDFVEIFSIKSFDEMNKQRLLISRKLETHDFDGVELKFTSYPVKNLVNFVSNDTVVTGAHGDIWQTLSSMLNFKMRVVRSEHEFVGVRSKNGSWNGLMGYIYRNETDIIPRALSFPSRLSALDLTLPTWTTGHRFYVKKQLYYPQTWMVELFSSTLWLSVIGLFFTLVFTSFLVHTLTSNNNETPNSACALMDHFFYIFSIFCNQGGIPNQLGNRSKILIISTRLCPWLLVMAFGSQLTSHIAHRHFRTPFDDLEPFYKGSEYNLVVRRDSFIYAVFSAKPTPIHKTIMDSGRLIQASISDAYKKTCTGKYVYLEVQDVVEANNFKGCEIHFIGKSHLNTGIAGGLVRGFKYKKTIDAGILKLYEFGIINRLKLKWHIKTWKMKLSVVKFDAIRLEHGFLIFGMLGCTALLSLVILLIENIVHLWHVQQNRYKR